MKTIARTVSLLFFVLSMSSYSSCNVVTVKGSGHVVTRNVPIEQFSKVDIDAPLEVVIEKGSTYSLTITGDDNLLELIDVNLSGNQLSITCTQKNYEFKKVKAHITLPTHVDHVQLSGLGSIELKAPVNPQLFSATMKGMGKLDLHDVTTEKMSANLSGMGKLEASGQVQQLKVEVNGMGVVECCELKAAEVDCHNSGMGSLSVYASERINAKLSGMGNLTYTGNPSKVDRSVTGMGLIHAK